MMSNNEDADLAERILLWHWELPNQICEPGPSKWVGAAACSHSKSMLPGTDLWNGICVLTELPGMPENDLQKRGEILWSWSGPGPCSSSYRPRCCCAPGCSASLQPLVLPVSILLCPCFFVLPLHIQSREWLQLFVQACVRCPCPR